MIHLLLAVIYISFISLGLPDSLLGSAWPTMYTSFGVPVSYAGIISMIVAFGTIVSSLKSDWLTKKLGEGRVTAFSVLLTAISIWGFSISSSFFELCLWALPYGLGAGSVDASLNNYVALHYASRHMSWLHCMWGVGASLGPYIMGFALSGGKGWHGGYRYISILQFALTFILYISLPLWKTKEQEINKDESKPLTIKEILSVTGVKEVMITFFCYCALEQTTGLWASSYLVLNKGIDTETAASFASLFFIGITGGRALSGFLTLKLKDYEMVRLGQFIILLGVLSIILPIGKNIALLGLVLIGLGCAPIYPSLIHSTPEYFGEDKSQAIIGIQMASAYIGTCLMPPLFGLIAKNITIALFPFYLAIILVLMILMHEKLLSKCKRG